MKVLICGGGTGGHIYPALAAVSELRRAGAAAADFLWIGTRGQMEERLVPANGLPLATIRGGPVVGVAPGTALLNGLRLLSSLLPVERLLSQFQPDVLLMTGGYVNIPVGLVARRRRVPSLIYLPDVEPGASIKLLSRLVDRVACTTEGSRPYFPAGKLEVTGYPVRPELQAARELTKAAALAQFGLAPGRKTLFVFGGSRGARSINRALTAILPELLAFCQVIHISGTLDWPQVEASAAALPADIGAFYRPYAYLDEQMGPAFRAADLIVARSGASMLGESPAFAVPSILVPYPYAWRYQKVNADFLVDQDAAVRLNDKALASDLLPTVRALLQNEARLAEMSAAAANLGVPDAAARLAQLMRRLAQGEERNQDD